MPLLDDDMDTAAQSFDAFVRQQELRQQMANQQAQRRQDLYNQLLRGNPMASQAAFSQLQQLAKPTPPKPPMSNAKFKVGDKVTVNGSTDIWIVASVRNQQAQYEDEIEYYLDNTNANASQKHTVEHGQFLTAVDGDGTPIQKAKVDFDTVVISDEKRDQILEALEQVNQQDLIFKVWGFNETIEKGKGVSMLFYGPPGTGKTLMAQALANKLKRTLKVISTADIESSAPGEAERNIRKHFKEAKSGKTILLFDECDSLIYTRQNVGPILSAQINELLSQIERFDGITLFTTNRLGTLDEAVNRRLALKLEFEMPSLAERAEIWRRMFPKKAPVAKDVDFERLAIVELTGGYIKNAVLRAVRMAAAEKIDDDKKKIRMKHLVKALRQEATAMDEFEEARKQHASGIGYSSGGIVRQQAGIGRG